MVESVEVVAVEQRMYNLTVDTAHTFFVGHGAWLVHNCGVGRRGAFRAAKRDANIPYSQEWDEFNNLVPMKDKWGNKFWTRMGNQS